MPGRAHVAICALFAFGVTACGDRGPDPALALGAAAPHTERFDDFERWARRALLADAALRTPSSLEETLFAPIRREEGLLGVRVQREGAVPRDVAFPTGFALPPDARWVSVNDARLGAIRVALAEVADPRDGGSAVPCVVISRTRPAGASEVTVTGAYRRAGEGAAR